eukprot:m.211060 g.211060  ORF g.211060 m.211060 type:complete len:138 (-) comp17146_c1_seq56:2429-2842(-)
MEWSLEICCLPSNAKSQFVGFQALGLSFAALQYPLSNWYTTQPGLNRAGVSAQPSNWYTQWSNVRTQPSSVSAQRSQDHAMGFQHIQAIQSAYNPQFRGPFKCCFAVAWVALDAFVMVWWKCINGLDAAASSIGVVH